ncbi:MAG: hypothetical protein PVI86_14170, partial [Phycisphaerae bacterium]
MSDQVKYDLPPGGTPRARQRWVASLAAFVLGGVIGFVVRPMSGSGAAIESQPSQTATPALLTYAELTALAKTLERNQLYAEAAGAWEQAAKRTRPNREDKAETLFRIGKNFSLANQHERALAYLFAAEAADENERWKPSITKLVLEGLSALGREDVRAHQVARRVALDAQGDDAPKTVAEIGGEPITELDIQS